MEHTKQDKIVMEQTANIFWPGPLFTMRTDVLPQDLAKSLIREIRV